MNNSSNFQPNWASTPGDTIRDLLRCRQLSLDVFANKMNSTLDNVKELLHGYISITEDIAKKLSEVLGASEEFWLRREISYRESVQRLRKKEEEKWLNELPIKEMVQLGWLKESTDLIKSLLDFFKVPDVWTWKRKYSEIVALTAFRKSSAIKSNPASIATWLRQGEIESNFIECKEWDVEKFKDALVKIRQLTKKKSPREFLPVLKKYCSNSGVALVILHTPSGCTASGATKFVSKYKALILLSFRYLTDDHFWFTFFHEAAHILLHKHKELFIEEGLPEKSSTIEEEEANEFSSEILIPKNLQLRLKTMNLNKRQLIDFAKDADIPLGIIIGQLQHLGRVPFKNLNGYKRRYDWNDIHEG